MTTSVTPLNQVQFPGNKGVATTYPGYDDNLIQWTRCRDCVAGTDAVKKKTEIYLPKLTQQEPADYRAMLMRATFFNATGRTVSAMTGMIFRKDPVIVVNSNIEELLKNVDLAGNTLEMFARKITQEVITVGKVGLLVDHTELPDIKDKPLTVGMVQQLGVRPLMKIYTAENILNYKYITVNNNVILSRVVLQEIANIPNPDNEWQDLQEVNYRVLDLDEQSNYRVRLFRKNKNDGADEQIGSDAYPLMNGNKLQYIPFMFICTDDNDADYDEPPILDLVDVNLSHYRTSSDYEHGCHFTALPTLYISGMSPLNPDGTPAKIYVGSQAALILPSPEAKVAYAEFSGDGLQTIERNMDRKEAQMAVLGARMLAPEKKSPETAFTTAMTKVGENSILASISIAASTALQKALYWFSLWVNPNITEDSIELKLNKDFLPVAIDGPTLTAYIAAYQAGALTEEELFDLLQRADMIEADITYDEHSAQASIEQAKQLAKEKALLPPAPMPGAPTGNPNIKNPAPTPND